MEGLWTIEFGSSEGVYSGGVVVFSGGKIMGGDAAYYYTGRYDVSNAGSFEATLHVKPFIEGVRSIFNTLRKEFTLNLKGTVKDADHAIAQGVPAEMPQMRLGIVLTRREAAVAA